MKTSKTLLSAVLLSVILASTVMAQEKPLAAIENSLIRCCVPSADDGGNMVLFIDLQTNDAFAKCSYDNAMNVQVTQTKNNVFEIAYSVPDQCDGVDRFTVVEDVPFVLVERSQRKQQTAASGCQVPTQTTTFQLSFPDRVEKMKSFGTAGLKSVDGHKGSYGFLAVVHSETRRGVVSGWVTQRVGSGTVFSNISDDGTILLQSVIEYGNENVVFQGESSPDIFAIGLFADCRTGLEQYAELVASINQIQLKPMPGAGYCTWYSNKYGGACDEKHIVELTQAAKTKLAPFGFDFVQIDDMWQLGVATNGPKKNFTGVDPRGPYPSGMKPTADMIRENGFLAGIWFMPFAGNVDDPHFPKDWYVQSGVADEVNTDGKSQRKFSGIVNKCGEPYESFWGGTSLDMSHPAVQAYLKEEVERISADWGYQYFKIDGIWTAMAADQMYINNEFERDDYGQSVFYDKVTTPMQAYRKGYDIIRAAAPDAFILGCNVSQNMRTMAGSYGLVDAMRIGPDNGSDWNGLKCGPWTGSNRYFLNARVWYNDPDPVYVRESMPLKHAQLLASWVSVSGQLYTFSDWLPELTAERIEVLQKTIPSHGLTTVHPVDLFDTDFPRVWHLWDDRLRTRRDVVALYNWESNDTTISETAARLELPQAEEYAVFDFWSQTLLGTFAARDTWRFEMPAESCRVLAIRPVLDHPMVISTSRHVTQGIVDILAETWDATTKTLSGRSRTVDGVPYEICIYVPKAYKELAEPVIRHTLTGTGGETEWSVTIP